MSIRPHPPGYHCSKALRRLGLDEHAIAASLRRELALTTGEIDVVLAFPITPPDGVPTIVDITDNPPKDSRRRRSDVETSTPLT